MSAMSRLLSKALQVSSLTLLLAFAGASIAPSAHAQSSTTGAIGGTVTDSAGALLPNAQITVTSVETQSSRKAKANSSGEFKITDLTPGTYTATIVVDGFQTSVTDNVVVSVGSTATITPRLVVGSVSDKVEVTDEAPALHLNDSGITSTIDQATIDNLPINGRRYSDFAVLTPGVVSNSDGFGLLSFRGISYLLNNTTVDGADDNQAYFSEARGRTRSSYTVTQGAVQEFQVNTSNYSAEYGRAAGGVINTVTKSGSNQLHGEVFFYDRDNALGGASNPYTQVYNFNENTGINPTNVKPKDWRKQYGFAVGGAIIKDKLFWFYAFDQQKRNFPGIARTSDPYDMFSLAKPLTGNEQCVASSDAYGHTDYGAPVIQYTPPTGLPIGPVTITSNLSDPAASTSASGNNLLSYPVGQPYQGNFGACAIAAALNPNQQTGALNYQQAAAYYNQGLGVLATFFGSVPRFQDQTINFPKIDWQINDRNRATFQYNRLRDDSPNGVQTQTSNFDGRGSYGNDFVKADVGIARLSTVVTNSIVNNLLVQYGRDMESESPSQALPNEQALVNPLSPGECSAPHGTGCVAGAPDLSVGFGYDSAGFDGGTSALFSRFALPDERRLQVRDDVTWSHGQHTFKFGLDYNKVSDYINNLYNGYGTYDYDWAYGFIGDYLHTTTGLGGAAYAGGTYTDSGAICPTPSTDKYCQANVGLYSSYSQGYTVPSNFNPTTFYGSLSPTTTTTTPGVIGNAGTPDNVGAKSLIATREYAGYATDDWRVTPKLTLTLGVRYEYEYVPGNPTPNPDLAGSSSTTDGAYFAYAISTLGSNLKSLPNTYSRPDDRNNVGPRLGFAYNVYGNGKMTIRGGYGMYFGRIINANVEQSYQNSGGPGSQVNVSNLFPDYSYQSSNACAINFPNNVGSYAQALSCAAYTSNASSHPSISYLDSHLQNPQVHEADLAIEQDLGKGWVLGVTYMGSFGRELDSANDVNVNLSNVVSATFYVNNSVNIAPMPPGAIQPHGGKAPPLPQAPFKQTVYAAGPPTNSTITCLDGTKTTCYRYDPRYYRILDIKSNVNSKYNALAFQINKKYSHGFSVLANYTWAHSLDYNPYIGTGIPGPSQLDPKAQWKDYGNSSLDVRNRFVFAATYQPETHFHGWEDYVLGGWRIAPVVQAQTGLPYTPYIAGYPAESAPGVRSANGAGGTSGRVDIIRRNQYYKPGTVKADARLGKNFYFNVNHFGMDRVRLEFFAEMFNIMNHQNITSVQTNAYDLGTANVSGITPTGNYDVLNFQPQFGTNNNSNSNYTYSPRQIQLAARLHF